VKTLIKKKENENVLTDLELINMKSIFFAVWGAWKKNNKGRKKKVNGKQKKISENSVTPTNIVGDGTRTKEEFGST
jgi:hypothetical protein